LEIEIDVTTLENPRFNLVGWYLEYITQNKMFYKQYIEHHRNTYRTLPDPEDLSIDSLITLQCGECKEKLILEQINNVL
jgi:hypothetical protein